MAVHTLKASMNWTGVLINESGLLLTGTTSARAVFFFSSLVAPVCGCLLNCEPNATLMTVEH